MYVFFWFSVQQLLVVMIDGAGVHISFFFLKKNRNFIKPVEHKKKRELFRCLIPPMSGMKYRRGNLVLHMHTTSYYRLVLRSIKG
jgi:hypothetical protein